MEVFVKEGKESYWLDVDEFIQRINGEKKRRYARIQKEIIEHDMNDLPRSLRKRNQ